MSGLGMTGGTSAWSPLAWNMRKEKVTEEERRKREKTNIEGRSLMEELRLRQKIFTKGS
jgi:hypothetical protein